MTEREFATHVVSQLQKHGYQGLWAGGCVRDELLGLVPHDYDIATDARPEQVQSLFKRTHTFGASFGVVEVLGPRNPEGQWNKVQVATFRSDGAYIDGRRPQSVTYSTAEEDAKRRDFTINGMFIDPVANQLIDYVGGQQDIEQKLLRAIGDAHDRFAEDKLRILRAIRMAARFELTIEANTLQAIREMSLQIVVISAERIAEELRKMLLDQHRARGIRLLGEVNLVEPILPELSDALANSESAIASDWHQMISMLDHLDEASRRAGIAVNFPLAFAVLLSPVISTHSHLSPDSLSLVCRRIATRLRFSKQETDHLLWILLNHNQLNQVQTLKKSQLYPLLVHPWCQDLLAWEYARAFGQRTSTESLDQCRTILHETPREALDPPFLVTGDDLIRNGFQPGPAFKGMITAIREAQLDGLIDSQEAGLQLAHSYLRTARP